PVTIKMTQKKYRLYKAFLRLRDRDKFLRFKKLGNYLTSELRKAKSSYYKQTFKDVTKQRPDVVWKNNNEILNRSRVFFFFFFSLLL
ncbi:MAG: hypothetical protein O7D30_03035, partial [Rickettsia endosymbiont of Ixodes persulcatus]|nr:hypothetical protein [Rickettsia endosymbiont of Ixodes persulcatus]